MKRTIEILVCQLLGVDGCRVGGIHPLLADRLESPVVGLAALGHALVGELSAQLLLPLLELRIQPGGGLPVRRVDGLVARCREELQGQPAGYASVVGGGR